MTGRNRRDANQDTEREREKEEEEEVDTAFGIGRWKTNALKESHHLIVFAVLSGLMGMFSGCAKTTLIGQAMSFEKHFNLEPTSVMQELFLSETMGAFLVVFSTGFVANYMAIPRITGMAGIGLGLGMAFPGFLNFAKPFEWPTFPGPPTPSPNMTGVHQPMGNPDFMTCNTPNISSQLPPPPTYDGNPLYGKLLGSGMVNYGMLSAIRWGPMPFLFLDNNVITKRRVAVYLAITICISELSKPLADLFNKHVDEIAVDMEETDLNPQDPMFVTAWWMGPIVFGFLTAAVSIPMLFLPANLLSSTKQSEQVHKASFKAIDKNIKMAPDDVIHVTRGKGMSLFQKMIAYCKGIPRIFTNPVFVILFLLWGIVVIPVVGLSLVNLQYTMFEYNIDSGEASKAQALADFVASLLASVGGAVACGYLHTKKAYLKFIMGCVFLSFVLLPVSFFLGCDNTPIYGLEDPDFGAKVANQNVSCVCDHAPKFPTCGADGKNYLSPCHAGCTQVSPQGMYVNCHNLDPGANPPIGIPGLCPDDCHAKFVSFNAVYTLTTLIYRMADIPKILLALRLIAPRDRGIAFSALGLSHVMSSALGPLILLQFFNEQCLVWFTETICLYFDRKDIRLLKTGVEFNTYLFSFILWLLMLLLNNFFDKKIKESSGKEEDAVKAPRDISSSNGGQERVEATSRF